jgi:hypothetical protein
MKGLEVKSKGVNRVHLFYRQIGIGIIGLIYEGRNQPQNVQMLELLLLFLGKEHSLVPLRLRSSINPYCSHKQPSVFGSRHMGTGIVGKHN